MALIIEDGSQVTNANSYVTDSEYTTYATARGLTVGSDAPTREIELIKAMDFIESHRSIFKGRLVTDTQALQWPRSGAWIDTFPVNADEIPVELKNAQIEAAIASNANDILKTGNVQNIKSESVAGAIKVEYFSGGSTDALRTERVNIYLTQLLNTSLGGFGAKVMRA